MAEGSIADLSITNSTARIVDLAPSEDSHFGSCRLGCVQSIKVFTCALSILACVNGAIAAAYLPAVITTIEERFQLDSSMSGLIVSSYEIGATISVILVSYLGHNGHIPLILGWGTVIIAVGSATFSIPHFVTESYSEQLIKDGIHKDGNVTEFCYANSSMETESSECISRTGSQNVPYIAIFIIAQILIGIGSSPILTIGLSYIDNIVKKKTSVQYIAFVYAASIVGAVLGFGVGSGMLVVYIDSFTGYLPKQFDITPGDKDRWVGAWWAGFVLFAILLCIIAPWMCMFPKTMEVGKSTGGSTSSLDDIDVPPSADITSGKLSEMPKSLLLLLKNPVYMLINLGSICEMMIVTGYLTFAAKYLETQFYISKTDASLYIGGVGVPAAVCGIVVLGYIMKKFKMGEMGAIKCILLLNLVGNCGFGVSFFLGCDNIPIAGVTTPYHRNDTIIQQLPINLTASCNAACTCEDNMDNPVCHTQTGITYVNLCYAGCQSSQERQCSCVAEYLDSNFSTDVTKDSCRSDCTNFPFYMVILFIISFAMAGTKTPIAVITLRHVSDELKSFGLGIQVMIIRLLALLPAPILYGAIIDSSCIWWKTECGVKQNCLVYSNDVFIFRFQGLSLAFHLLGSVIFFIAWLLMRRNFKSDDSHEPGCTEEVSKVTRL